MRPVSSFTRALLVVLTGCAPACGSSASTVLTVTAPMSRCRTLRGIGSVTAIGVDTADAHRGRSRAIAPGRIDRPIGSMAVCCFVDPDECSSNRRSWPGPRAWPIVQAVAAQSGRGTAVATLPQATGRRGGGSLATCAGGGALRFPRIDRAKRRAPTGRLGSRPVRGGGRLPAARRPRTTSSASGRAPGTGFANRRARRVRIPILSPRRQRVRVPASGPAHRGRIDA